MRWGFDWTRLVWLVCPVSGTNKEPGGHVGEAGVIECRRHKQDRGRDEISEFGR